MAGTIDTWPGVSKPIVAILVGQPKGAGIPGAGAASSGNAQSGEERRKHPQGTSLDQRNPRGVSRSQTRRSQRVLAKAAHGNHPGRGPVHPPRNALRFHCPRDCGYRLGTVETRPTAGDPLRLVRRKPRGREFEFLVVRRRQRPVDGALVDREGTARRRKTATDYYWISWQSALMWMLISWAIHRCPRNERQSLVESALQSQSDLGIQEEVQIMSSDLGQTLEEWAEEKGIEKGSLNTCRELLCDQLEEHLGSVPDDVRQRIEEATDLAKLRAAVRQAHSLKTFEGLDI